MSKKCLSNAKEIWLMKQDFYFYRILVFFSSLFFSSCNNSKERALMNFEQYKNLIQKSDIQERDIASFFPKNVDEVKKHAAYCIQLATEGLARLYAFADEQRTFDNTPRAFDTLASTYHRTASILEILKMVTPDKEIRDACTQAALQLRQFSVEAFMDVRLYNAFQVYSSGAGQSENLNDEQRYFLDESMKDFKREGLHLPLPELEAVKALKKEISQIQMNYENNADQDHSTILVDREGLRGLDEEFIKSLKQENGKYVLDCSYPTYFNIIEHCQIEQTRKDHYRAFSNRAYPANIELLESLIAKRDQLAKMLGFESYAALNIDSEMAKTPTHVQEFLDHLIGKTDKKVEQEFALLKSNLPEGVTLDEKGRIKPWDRYFIEAEYKKKHFNIDERAIAEYFPVQKAMDGMFAIYQDFLDLTFEDSKPDWSWDSDVRLLKIKDRSTDEVRGYLFLDLYPRPHKYSHACCYPIVAAQEAIDPTTGKIIKVPSVAVVIANFPKAQGDRPALLKHHDVTTFFHEFGHAMHGVMGRTEMASFSGTSVKTDFVEMPSQIFEEWMYDHEMLDKVSSHYKTGESLPYEMIKKKIELKQFDSGYFVRRQCWLSSISLNYYREGAQKDTQALQLALAEKYFGNYIGIDSSTHFQASFGHLTGYGARYYGYMWSKVFALDLFYELKKRGLTNPETGKAFTQALLNKGGSKDPNQLLREFLGREPEQDSFLHDLGLV